MYLTDHTLDLCICCTSLEGRLHIPPISIPLMFNLVIQFDLAKLLFLVGMKVIMTLFLCRIFKNHYIVLFSLSLDHRMSRVQPDHHQNVRQARNKTVIFK